MIIVGACVVPSVNLKALNVLACRHGNYQLSRYELNYTRSQFLTLRILAITITLLATYLEAQVVRQVPLETLFSRKLLSINLLRPMVIERSESRNVAGNFTCTIPNAHHALIRRVQAPKTASYAASNRKLGHFLTNNIIIFSIDSESGENRWVHNY